jgi:hypothetical protein
VERIKLHGSLSSFCDGTRSGSTNLLFIQPATTPRINDQRQHHSNLSTTSTSKHLAAQSHHNDGKATGLKKGTPIDNALQAELIVKLAVETVIKKDQLRRTAPAATTCFSTPTFVRTPHETTNPPYPTKPTTIITTIAATPDAAVVVEKWHPPNKQVPGVRVAVHKAVLKDLLVERHTNQPCN